MIDSNIWKHGATSITVSVSRWKSDKVTPETFLCRIEHEGNNPSAITAERDNALAAERECVESFITYFTKKPKRPHEATKALRPSATPAKKVEAAEKPKPKSKPKLDDDFEY